MGLVRGVAVIALLLGVLWAMWFIAWYAGLQTSGTTLAPPPGVNYTPG